MGPETTLFRPPPVSTPGSRDKLNRVFFHINPYGVGFPAYQSAGLPPGRYGNTPFAQRGGLAAARANKLVFKEF